MKLITGTGLAMLVACAAAQSPNRDKSQAAEFKARSALAAKLREEFRSGLKDPESARFSSLVLSESETAEKTLALCGLVNAKNSYGGYTGNTGFVINTAGLVVIESSEPAGAFRSIWPVWCSRPLPADTSAKSAK